MVQYRGGISILEIVVFAPCTPIAIWLTVRHGLRRSAGWIYVMLFAQVRVAGAITQLLSQSHPTNTSLYTAEAVLQSFGLNPLLFIALCHLSRVNRSIAIARSGSRPVARWITHAIGGIVIGASALCIVGGIDGAKTLISQSASGTTKPFHATTATKVGILLFLVSFINLAFMTMRTATQFPVTEPGERRLGYAILLSLPFIGIRILYSLLTSFSKSPDLNLLTGSVTIWLFMAVLEEMAVVAIFLGIGSTMEGIEKRKWRMQIPAAEDESI